MKKFYSLFCALAFTATVALAQGVAPSGADVPPQFHQQVYSAAPVSPGDPDAPGNFPAIKEGRFRLNLSPNPVTLRTVLDAGGVILGRVTISDSNGHMLRLYSAVNAERLEIVRDDLSPGVYLVQAVTAQGSSAIKMMVE